MEKAKNIARAWWFEREADLKAGYQLVGKPFNEAAEAFLADYKSKAEAGFTKFKLSAHTEKDALVHRYFIPYFHNTPLDRIGKNVRDVLEQIRDAVDAGELDKLLEATATEARKRMSGK